MIKNVFVPFLNNPPYIQKPALKHILSNFAPQKKYNSNYDDN